MGLFGFGKRPDPEKAIKVSMEGNRMTLSGDQATVLKRAAEISGDKKMDTKDGVFTCTIDLGGALSAGPSAAAAPPNEIELEGSAITEFDARGWHATNIGSIIDQHGKRMCALMEKNLAQPKSFNLVAAHLLKELKIEKTSESYTPVTNLIIRILYGALFLRAGLTAEQREALFVSATGGLDDKQASTLIPLIGPALCGIEKVTGSKIAGYGKDAKLPATDQVRVKEFRSTVVLCCDSGKRNLAGFVSSLVDALSQPDKVGEEFGKVHDIALRAERGNIRKYAPVIAGAIAYARHAAQA